MDCTVVYCGMVIKITRMNNCAVQVADRGRSWPEIKKALAKARKKKPIKDSTVVYCGTVIKITRMSSSTKMLNKDCTIVYVRDEHDGAGRDPQEYSDHGLHGYVQPRGAHEGAGRGPDHGQYDRVLQRGNQGSAGRKRKPIMDCTVVYCGMVIRITRMNSDTVQVADRGRSWPIEADRGRSWPIVADRGRKWPNVADRGRSWPIVADRGRS